MSDVTRILQAIERGEAGASARLLPLIDDEHRKLAARQLAYERSDQTLQSTALVHNAYMRPVDDGPEGGWSGRGHSFAAATTAMRRILIGGARQTRRRIRGGGHRRRGLHPGLVTAPEANQDLLSPDAAPAQVAGRDSVKARLLELRSFAGLHQRSGGRDPRHLRPNCRPLPDRHKALAPPREGRRGAGREDGKGP
jgi:RNA polymerase sigma factor (TIGR02999 family)